MHKLPQPDDFRNFLGSEEAGKLVAELADILWFLAHRLATSGGLTHSLLTLYGVVRSDEKAVVGGDVHHTGQRRLSRRSS